MRSKVIFAIVCLMLLQYCKRAIGQRYQFNLTSAGFDDGKFAVILINGVDYAVNTRGHNVAVVNAKTLEIESRVFDTFGIPAKVTEMMTYLEHIPYGSLIAIAIHDSTSSSNMDDAFVTFMESLGAGTPDCAIRVGFRDSWAFITQKVKPGSPFPDWKGCSHVPLFGGPANLDATIDFAPCDSYPCQNGGTCTNEGDGYKCECPTTHAGVNCESLRFGC